MRHKVSRYMGEEWQRGRETLKNRKKRKIPFQAAAYRSGILQNLLDETSIKLPSALSPNQNLMEVRLENPMAHNCSNEGSWKNPYKFGQGWGRNGWRQKKSSCSKWYLAWAKQQLARWETQQRLLLNSKLCSGNPRCAGGEGGGGNTLWRN